MKTMLDYALKYLSLGYSVFPLMQGGGRTDEGEGVGKRPLAPALPGGSWSAYQKRLPTEAEVRRWWRKWPKANVAIVTGRVSGLVVVDVDPKHGGTAEGLPPTGLVQETRSGGSQHFYAYPKDVSGVPNQVNTETGRDVRADGGYVVAPPSVVLTDIDHEACEPEPGPGAYSWTSWGPDALTDPPDWAVSAPEPAEDSPPEADRWLTRLLADGPEPGGWNKALVRMAGYYAAKGIPADAAMALCIEWTKRFRPKKGLQEARTTIKSAYKAESRRARKRAPVVADDELLPMVPLAEFMEKHGDATEKWTIEGWLPQGTICFLVSPPQSYKTFVTFDLAISLASGRKFLGEYDVLQTGTVGIFQQEDALTDVAERTGSIVFSKLGIEPPRFEDDYIVIDTIEPSELPILYHEQRKLRFDDDAVMDALEAWCERERPVAVILDPLYSAVDMANDEHMAKATRKMMRLKDIRDRLGTTFIIVHHASKGMTSWDREKVWGSQFVNAFIETSWLMKKDPNASATVVKRHTKVAGGLPFIEILFDMQTDQEPYYYRTTPRIITSEEADDVLQPAQSSRTPSKPRTSAERPIMEFLAGGPAGVDALAAATGMSHHLVSSTLRSLLSKSRVRCDAVGKWEITAQPEIDGLG